MELNPFTTRALGSAPTGLCSSQEHSCKRSRWRALCGALQASHGAGLYRSYVAVQDEEAPGSRHPREDARGIGGPVDAAAVEARGWALQPETKAGRGQRPESRGPGRERRGTGSREEGIECKSEKTCWAWVGRNRRVPERTRERGNFLLLR